MDPKMRDLEMIFNLQWKAGRPAAANGGAGGDRSNIIGVYDIPSTTFNWDVFKSYLLKNSGTDLNDVKVYYVTSNEREFPIDSQTDFQIALYAFRRKARNNKIISLKLDSVTSSDPKPAPKNRFIDVETQADTVDSTTPTPSMETLEAAPGWFTQYMAQFKQDILKEVKSAVTEAVGAIQPVEVPAVPAQVLPESYSWRKSKSDAKRVRKSALPSSHANRQQNERELIKSIKIERKLESKLEKLENKTKKLREKKLALISKSTSDSDGGPTCSNKRSDRKRNYTMPLPSVYQRPEKTVDEEEAVKSDQEPVYEMDAKVLSKDRPMFFTGGEVFFWTWLVQNTGTKPWTSETSAIFTWGSKALQPVQYTIACPRLQPGETGKIINLLEIPCMKGKYECYYHFHHKDRRFGQCLSCQIYVDPMGQHEAYQPDKEDELPAKKIEIASTSSVPLPQEQPEPTYPYNMDKLKTSLEQQEAKDIKTTPVNAEIKKEHDTYFSSDSDNQSDGSESDEGFKDEFIMVPVPDCFKLDKNMRRVDYAKLLQEAYKTAKDQPSTSQPSNCYRVDSMDLFVDWPKNAEGGSGPEELQPPESFDDNNNTASRSPSVSALNDSDVGSAQSDTVVIVRNHTEDGYAYVEVNGKGLHVPQKILKSEYIEKLDTPNKTKTPSTISIASSSVVVINDDEDTQNEQNPEVLDDTFEPIALPPELQSFGTSTPVSVPTTQLISLPSSEEAIPTPSAPACSSTTSSEVQNDAEPLNLSLCPLKGRYRTFVFPQSTPGFEVNPTLVESQQPPEMSLNLSNVPNYQQTPPELRQAPDPQGMSPTQPPPTAPTVEEPLQYAQGSASAPPVHILPETLVSGAVNVASSAINTARSVINMIVPPQWVHEDCTPANASRPHEANMHVLYEMGFWDHELNLTLLNRHNGDLSKVVTDLIH